MATTVTPGFVAQVAERYPFRGSDVGDAVAAAGPEVAALLLEAADQIAAYFGEGTNVVLQLFTDPEDEDEPGEIFAFIQTPLKFAQARAGMQRFC